MFHRGERAHQPASQPASHPTDQPTTVSSTLMPFNLNIHYRTHIYTHNAVIEKSMAGAADLAQRATILFFFFILCASNPFLRLLILKLLSEREDMQTERQQQNTHSLALMLEMWPDETIFLLSSYHLAPVH
jgi:hypothetical protein